MSDTAYKPFGACLADLLARHNLTAASVSRLLGHKSRTTLRRILQDQANSESMEKFLDEFIAAQPFKLTPQEKSELEQSLEISRIGLTGFRARESLSGLLHPSAAPSPSVGIHDVQTGRTLSSEQFFGELSAAVHLKFLITNDIPPVFFESLVRFLNGPVRIEIEHYFFLNDDIVRTVQFLSSIFPALKYPGYTPYAIPSPLQNAVHSAQLTCSILACRCEFPDGEVREYQLGCSEPGTGHLIRVPSGVYDFWEGMLAPRKAQRLPVKLSARASGDSLDSYLRMAESYLDLEINRTIFMLKPGLCLSLISPGLLKAPMRDGMNQTSFSCDPSLPEFLRQLTAIHEKRFENIYHKKRVTHVLVPYDSLRAFAQTGRLADQFFGMRPFTVRERREILTHCRNQSRDNPYFNLYFLKGDGEALVREAVCYESRGVLIHDSGTDYRLSGTHADALIALEDFTALFSRYFRETLLPQRAHSVGTSVSILSALIDELPEE